MTGRQNFAQLGVYGGIVALTVIGAILLGWQGTLSESGVLAIFGAAVGFAGGVGAGATALYTVVNGKSLVTSQQVSEQGATQRTAIVAAAASQPTPVEPVVPTQPEPEH